MLLIELNESLGKHRTGGWLMPDGSIEWYSGSEEDHHIDMLFEILPTEVLDDFETKYEDEIETRQALYDWAISNHYIPIVVDRANNMLIRSKPNNVSHEQMKKIALYAKENKLKIKYIDFL